MNNVMLKREEPGQKRETPFLITLGGINNKQIAYLTGTARPGSQTALGGRGSYVRYVDSVSHACPKAPWWHLPQAREARC